MYKYVKQMTAIGGVLSQNGAQLDSMKHSVEEQRRESQKR